MPSPTRPSARSVTTAASGSVLYFCLMGACRARSSSAFISGSLTLGGHAGQFVDPGQRRAAPELRARPQLGALAQRADAQVVERRILLGRGPQARAAVRAEGLRA